MNQAKGNFDGPHQAYQIGANDQLLSSADYAPLIIAYQNGAPVKLTDVATVIDDIENVRQAAWMNETPAVIVNIQRQPGANIIAVVDRIKTLLPQLTAYAARVGAGQHPDRPDQHHPGLGERTCEFELMLTIGLVVMVIFLFLRNLVGHHHSQRRRAAFAGGHVRRDVPAGLQPEQSDADGADHFHRLRGGRRHRDDREHQRYIEEGETPLEAALKGSEQIGFTIVSLTISLIAVLIPLLFMGDIVGRLFREFAVTLSVTILVSAVVSLTLTPMMCAKLLKHTPEHQQGRFYRASERGFNWIIDFTARRCKCVLRFQTLTLLVAVATLALTIFLFLVHPQGILSHSGYRRDSGRFGSGADRLVPRNVAAAAARWRR